MRAASTAMLVAGFGIGFGLMYTYISPKAADIIKPIPQFVPSAPSSAPKVDPAVVKQLEDMLKADPKNFEALRELGNIRYDERDFSEAAALYARALEVKPDDVNTRSDRGGALFEADRVDEAIQELKTVLSKEPTHPQALYILGVALLRGKNDREGAVAQWKKLLESHPELPDLDLVRKQIEQVEQLSRRK
jgi:cytochrome c-type biogenesis protein CcmH/NrfG